MKNANDKAKSTQEKPLDRPKQPSVWRSLKELDQVPNSTLVDVLVKQYDAKKDVFVYSRIPDNVRDHDGVFPMRNGCRLVAWMPLPELIPPDEIN